MELNDDLWYNTIRNYEWSGLVIIETKYITLGQLLKFAGIAGSGGDIKYLLANSDILVNGEIERRRGKKLYPGDTIVIDDEQITIEHD